MKGRRPRLPYQLRLLLFGSTKSSKENMRSIHPETVFILSTGRTGTQFLAKFLNKQKNIYAVHEPKPSRRLRFWTMAYLQGLVSNDVMEKVLWRYRHRLVSKISEDKYVESNNFLAGFSEVLKKQFKTPIIVHVIRDPREHARSAINHGTDHGLKGFANRHVPFAFLKPEYVQKQISRNIRDQDKILARTLIYWKRVNECLEEAGKDYSNYHLFRFEDLFGKSDKDLKRIMKIVGAEDISKANFGDRKERANVSRLKVMPAWRDWSQEQAKLVDTVCGPLMAKYGYGKEEQWQEKIGK